MTNNDSPIGEARSFRVPPETSETPTAPVVPEAPKTLATNTSPPPDVKDPIEDVVKLYKEAFLCWREAESLVAIKRLDLATHERMLQKYEIQMHRLHDSIVSHGDYAHIEELNTWAASVLNTKPEKT